MLYREIWCSPGRWVLCTSSAHLVCRRSAVANKFKGDARPRLPLAEPQRRS